MAEIKEKHPSWFKMKLERRELIRQLSPETAVNVLLACWDYLETGEKPLDLSPIENIAFASFIPDLGEAWGRYQQRISARSSGKVVSLDTERHRSISSDTEEEPETEPETEPEGRTQKDVCGAGKPPRALRSTSEDWGVGPELTAAFEDWLRYKREKRQEYKPTGLKSLVTQVKNNAEKYGDAAVVALIRECMAANWQGISWEKLDKPQAADRNRLRTEADYGDDAFFKR